MNHQWLLYLFAGVALGCIGSFIGVCVDRLPRGDQIVRGRSRCDSCGRELKAYELVPIISYLALRGRCKVCKAKIPASCLLTELLTVCTGLLVLFLFGFTVRGISCAAVSCALVYMALYDQKTTEIPNTPIVFVALVGTSLMVVNRAYLDSLIGCVIVSIPFAVLALLGLMGWGDVKLMAAIGLLMGWQLTLVSTFLGILVGSLSAILMLIFFGKKRKSEIAFGPYLCIGAYVGMCVGQRLMDCYLSLF